MVKIIPALVGLSASLAVVLAHAGHGKFGSLEKRGAAAPEPDSCKSPYAPVAAGMYPILDCIPFVQDPQVQTWLKQYDISKAPVFPLSNDGLCPANTASIPADQCWWTCQKCTAPNDVTFCPKAGTWGLTYDDGPTPDSERLYDVLKAHGTKATLFIVGSRAISYPNTLKRAYNEGHQIAVHTWSHPMMTSLSNEQVVAELKWTEKAIFDTIGVTPLYWRPPYGDVDNRVRYIATALGFKTSIWTDGFDTNDWNIPAGKATPQSVVATFQTWLTKIPTMSTGFIVLEHDLFPAEVNVSINSILPLAYADTALTMMPIAKCVGDASPYKEGAGTFVLGGPAASPSGASGSLPGATGSSSAAGPTIVNSGKSSDALSLMSQSAPLVMTVAAVGSSMLMAAAGIVF